MTFVTLSHRCHVDVTAAAVVVEACCDVDVRVEEEPPFPPVVLSFFSLSFATHVRNVRERKREFVLMPLSQAAAEAAQAREERGTEQ